jgi:hypothetical protein
MSTAQRLSGGDTLLTDFSSGRAVQVNRKGEVIWEKTGLNMPCWGLRLERAPDGGKKAPGDGKKAPAAP